MYRACVYVRMSSIHCSRIHLSLVLQHKALFSNPVFFPNLLFCIPRGSVYIYAECPFQHPCIKSLPSEFFFSCSSIQAFADTLFDTETTARQTIAAEFFFLLGRAARNNEMLLCAYNAAAKSYTIPD